MTQITFDQMSDYLNSGARLDDVISMIEMMIEYKEEILTGIYEWHDLIPEAIAWNDQTRRKQLKTIVTWLLRHGYVVRWARLDADGDRATWEIVRDEQLGHLTWDGAFKVSGIDKVEESPNEAFRFPEFLTWI
jgi:hypothetical protein